LESSYLETADILDSIKFEGLGSISLAYHASEIKANLDAYGIVICNHEARKIDGIQFSSSKWNFRCPKGSKLLRIFYGGPHTRFMLTKSEDEIKKIVYDELKSILGIQAAPYYSDLKQWNNAYPQYNVGHVKKVDKLMKSLPKEIKLAGNAYFGVGIPDTIKSAKIAVDRLIEDLDLVTNPDG
ncbi:MAG: FAD-dependent oxidoreductase, partial [Candidatus Heimdallarchaeota archaeon]|nr:FAD-dependent oxidoreductase [Candidatus Heimdallarchaeota archaeon]